MTIRIAILGIGAMGCLFGARLSPHADVTLIGQWPAQRRALAAAPLRYVHPDGHEDRVRLRAVSDPRQVGTVDLALIVTKAGKTAAAAQVAAGILAPTGVAVTLQNGLGNDTVLADVLGADRVTVGVTTQGASTGGAPGVVIDGGAGLTVLATRPPIEAQVRAAAALFERGGLRVDIAVDVRALVWGKLAVNAAINPLTAILRVPNGALVGSDWTRVLVDQVAGEVSAVAAAQGITLPMDAAAQARDVARRTAANRSSMLQDVLRGAETEIDAINGAVVRVGEAQGVPVPVNRVLYTVVKALETGYPVQILHETGT